MPKCVICLENDTTVSWGWGCRKCIEKVSDPSMNIATIKRVAQAVREDERRRCAAERKFEELCDRVAGFSGPIAAGQPTPERDRLNRWLLMQREGVWDGYVEPGVCPWVEVEK